MVELLVVLVIVAILAAVATPIYLANVQRSRASEAISTMALVRQAQRDFQISNGGYFNVSTGAASGSGTIVDPLPASVAAGGVPVPVVAGADSGLDIEQGVAQYFGNTSIIVDTTQAGTAGASTMFTNPNVVDFLITATGNDSAPAAAAPVLGENNQCVGNVTNCATKTAEVAAYIVEMDNSGRTFVSYNSGTDWGLY